MNKPIRFLLSLCWLVLFPSIAQENQPDTTKAISWAGYPALGYQPETGLQLGGVAVGVLNRIDDSQSEFVRQSSLTPFFIYTTRNQILAACNVDYYFKSGANLNITPRYFKFPDKYFGIGNSNDPDTFEDYTSLFFQLDGVVLMAKTPRFFWGAALDFQTISFKEKETGGVLETNTINGSEGGALFGIGPAMRYDSRNNIIYPSNGYLLNVNTLFAYLGDFGYSSYLFDVRKYISLKGDSDVLAIQLSGIFTGGSNVPFFKLPQLGGDNRLRGITNASLYRDRQAFFSQVEYRKSLFWIVGAVVFAGVGDVANELGDLSLSEFKYVGGVGARFQIIPEQRLNVRFDYGLAKGGQSAFYVGLREAF